MRVRVGWSGETESNVWQKADVELDGEDFARLLRENDLRPDLAGSLPSRIVFQLMQNEAEAMLLIRLRGLGYPPEKAISRIADLTESNLSIVHAIKNQLAPA